MARVNLDEMLQQQGDWTQAPLISEGIAEPALPEPAAAAPPPRKRRKIDRSKPRGPDAVDAPAEAEPIVELAAAGGDLLAPEQLRELVDMALLSTRRILSIDVTKFQSQPVVMLKLISMQNTAAANVLSLQARVDDSPLRGKKIDQMAKIIQMVRETESKLPAA